MRRPSPDVSSVPRGAPYSIFFFYSRLWSGTLCRLQAHRSGVAMHVLTDCGHPAGWKFTCEAASRETSFFFFVRGSREALCIYLFADWLSLIHHPVSHAGGVSALRDPFSPGMKNESTASFCHTFRHSDGNCHAGNGQKRTKRPDLFCMGATSGHTKTGSVGSGLVEKRGTRSERFHDTVASCMRSISFDI